VPHVRIDSADIEAAVHRVGLTGLPVEVHVSLRSFGGLAEGPSTIVEGLLAAGCTVLAATMAPRLFGVPAPADDRPVRNGLDYERQDAEVAAEPWPGMSDVYDPSRTEVASWLGGFSAHLAGRPDRVRAPLGTGEFSAVGPLASELIAADTDADVFGPLRALVRLRGGVVLMGVGLTSMTLLHLAEVEAGRRPFIRWARRQDGETVRVRVGECSDGFEALAAPLRPVEHTCVVGNSLWRVYDARATVELSAAAIRQDPSITRCSKASCIECEDAIAGGPPT
jgi:aminoglycoside N3'-acetyltransferase